MNDYDPVECLRKEVERFQSTNQFSPLLVTNLYAQAACVLTELQRTRDENNRLKSRMRSLENQIDKLEDALLETE
jgi:peptidoglycan hydrolase CwlO-like protein